MSTSWLLCWTYTLTLGPVSRLRKEKLVLQVPREQLDPQAKLAQQELLGLKEQMDPQVLAQLAQQDKQDKQDKQDRRGQQVLQDPRVLA